MTIALEQQVDDLKAEVEYWKNEARATAQVRQVDQFRRAYGFTSAEAWLVGALYSAGRGKAVRVARLLEDMDVPGIKRWDHRDEASNTMQVMVCRIRKRIGADGVQTARGMAAYSLSEDAWDRCHEVLIEAGLVRHV